MTDIRALCWLNAQNCMAKADEVLKKAKLTDHDTEIPLAARLYLTRAQILATLSCAPVDVIMAVEQEAEAREKEKAKQRKDFEDMLQKHETP